MKYVKIKHKELGESEVIASSLSVFEKRGWTVVEELERPSSGAPVAQGDEQPQTTSSRRKS